MAIDDLPDEHEQGERVRTWLRENGLGIIAGVVVAFGLVGGWRWWQSQQQTQRVEAGAAYQRMVADLAGGDVADAQSQVASMRGTPYEVLAALDVAKAQVDAGELDAAIRTLQGADASDPALEPIRRQRLGQLLVEVERAEEAVALLRYAKDATGLETLGDAHLALDQDAEAREAYARALAQTDVASPGRGLIEIKLAAAGGEPTPDEAS